MKNKCVHVPVPEISAAVQNRLFELGYHWAYNGKNVSNTEYEYLVFYLDGGGICYSTFEGISYEKVTIEELFSPSFPSFAPPRPDVILPPGEIVPDYAVKIREKGITVGCQTVSFPAFETLAAAVERYLSNK